MLGDSDRTENRVSVLRIFQFKVSTYSVIAIKPRSRFLSLRYFLI